MKIRIILLLVCIFCAARVLDVKANDTTSFTDNLKNCAQYYGSQTIELNDVKLVSTKQILGFEGDKCVYKESISTADSKYTVSCKLSKSNIADLVAIMEDFEKDPKAQNIDLNDFTQVESSSVVTGWSKYLQDPEICSIEVN